MTTKTKPPGKLARARVLYTDADALPDESIRFVQPHIRHDSELPVLVIPCTTAKQARLRARVENLTYWQQVDLVATELGKLRNGKTWPVSAQDVTRVLFTALGHTAP